MARAGADACGPRTIARVILGQRQSHIESGIPHVRLKDYPQHVLHEAGWHTRGYLPHFDGRTKPQSITLHLADSVPVRVIERWEDELRNLSDEHRVVIMRERIDKYLDQGYGECYLRDQRIAKLVQDSLLKYVAFGTTCSPGA